MISLPENLQAQWARLIVQGLVRLGARDFVVSPGSRSTPLALALLGAEANSGGLDLRIHSIIDERSAGFFALGVARETGIAPVLICTSGTAPAHYYPAVIEAFESRLPLIVLSADRPPELQEVGAAQTIVQTELFGRYVARFSDFGAASARPGSFEALAHKLELAWTTSRNASRPVHLNAPFYKPLEPGGSEGALERSQREQVDQILAGLPRVRQDTHRGSMDEGALGAALAESRDPLFILGVLDPEEGARVEELLAREARARGCTRAELLVFGEAASGSGHALDIEVALRAAGDQLTPDSVFQFGSRICSARYFEWLGRRRPKMVVVQGSDAFDPSRSAALNLCGSFREMVVDQIAGPRAPLGARVRERNANLLRSIGRILEERLRTPGPKSESLDEARALSLTLRALPADTDLFVGNSLPLRLANAALPIARQDRRPLGRVFVQRGVNGIDGLIAGAAGLAAIPGSHPVALFLGDVSAAHDLASLALARSTKRPLSIWIFDNGGGRIFDQLPLGRDPPGRFDLWRTPPQIDFAAVATALGLESRVVESEEVLLQLLETLPGKTGTAQVIQVKTRGPSGVEFFDSIGALDEGS